MRCFQSWSITRAKDVPSVYCPSWVHIRYSLHQVLLDASLDAPQELRCGLTSPLPQGRSMVALMHMVAELTVSSSVSKRTRTHFTVVLKLGSSSSRAQTGLVCGANQSEALCPGGHPKNDPAEGAFSEHGHCAVRAPSGHCARVLSSMAGCLKRSFIFIK